VQLFLYNVTSAVIFFFIFHIIYSISDVLFHFQYLYFLWAVNLPKVKIQCGLWCYFFQGKTQSKFVISRQFKKKKWNSPSARSIFFLKLIIGFIWLCKYREKNTPPCFTTSSSLILIIQLQSEQVTRIPPNVTTQFPSRDPAGQRL